MKSDGNRRELRLTAWFSACGAVISYPLIVIGRSDAASYRLIVLGKPRSREQGARQMSEVGRQMSDVRSQPPSGEATASQRRESNAERRTSNIERRMAKNRSRKTDNGPRDTLKSWSSFANQPSPEATACREPTTWQDGATRLRSDYGRASKNA